MRGTTPAIMLNTADASTKVSVIRAGELGDRSPSSVMCVHEWHVHLTTTVSVTIVYRNNVTRSHFFRDLFHICYGPLFVRLRYLYFSLFTVFETKQKNWMYLYVLFVLSLESI